MEAEPWDGASEYFAAMSQSQLLAVLLGTTALLQALYRAGRTPPHQRDAHLEVGAHPLMRAGRCP